MYAEYQINIGSQYALFSSRIEFNILMLRYIYHFDNENARQNYHKILSSEQLNSHSHSLIIIYLHPIPWPRVNSSNGPRHFS